MKQTSIESLYSIYLKHPIISKDTRTISKGCIYFAMKGDNFDGNLFANEALEKGAAYAVVDDEKLQGERYLFVKDSLQALQQLANFHRNQLRIPVIAISGSNGKTTTKELIAAALAPKYNVLFTDGNYNNHIGVPLTLLRIRAEHEIAVIEMGANHQGEIDFLCNIAQPDFGLLTNIGKAHLEGFGGEEGVRKGKTELFRYIAQNNGKLFINLDDEKIRTSIPEVEYISYGNTTDADCQGVLEETHPQVKGSWKMGENSGQIVSTLYGGYNFQNILSACCIASYFGVQAQAIDQAINSYESTMNRSQLITKASNTYYMDSYNANPTSMSLSLANFEKVQATKKLAILGDMFELGDVAKEEHLKITEQATVCQSIDSFVFVGKHFQEVEEQQSNFLFFETTQAAKAWLIAQNLTDTSILLKGSRGMQLETLVSD